MNSSYLRARTGILGRLPLTLYAVVALLTATANGSEPPFTNGTRASFVSADELPTSSSLNASAPTLLLRRDRSNSDGALEKRLPAQVQRFVDSDRANPPAHLQVLFVGSSSIAGWTTLGRDMAPIPVLNRGFDGAQIEHVNRWFDQLVSSHQPRAIVFYAGENDIAAGKTVAQVVADFDAFMAKKTATLGPVPVYFISLKPSKLRFAQFIQQSEVNSAVRSRADHRSDLHYIDIVAPMLQDGHPRDLFVGDGLHMTPEGYTIWTHAVKTALDEKCTAQHE